MLPPLLGVGLLLLVWQIISLKNSAFPSPAVTWQEALRLFADPFACDKFAHYFFKLHEDAAALDAITVERAHQRIEEASLFIEAAHACYDRMQSASKPS